MGPGEELGKPHLNGRRESKKLSTSHRTSRKRKKRSTSGKRWGGPVSWGEKKVLRRKGGPNRGREAMCWRVKPPRLSREFKKVKKLGKKRRVSTGLARKVGIRRETKEKKEITRKGRKYNKIVKSEIRRKGEGRVQRREKGGKKRGQSVVGSPIADGSGWTAANCWGRKKMRGGPTGRGGGQTKIVERGLKQALILANENKEKRKRRNPFG